MRWDRVGRVALVLVLFGVMVSYLNPLVNLVDAWQGLEAERGAAGRAEAEQHRSAAARCDEAESPLTLEREARKLGMVKPGEHAYVVRRPRLTALDLGPRI